MILAGNHSFSPPSPYQNLNHPPMQTRLHHSKPKMMPPAKTKAIPELEKDETAADRSEETSTSGDSCKSLETVDSDAGKAVGTVAASSSLDF